MLSIAIVSLVTLCVACNGPTSPSVTPAAAMTSSASPAVSAVGGVAVAGKVYDTAYRELAGAVVEVLNGPSAGMKATADGHGQFALFGAFDEATRFRATTGGHAEGIARLGPSCAICHPNFWIYFNLAVPDPPAALAGDYTVTFIADPACVSLPEHARQRTYSVHVAANANQPTPADTTLTGFIEDNLVGRSWDGIWFAVAANYIDLALGDLHGDPGFIEQTAPNEYYSVGGFGSTTLGPGGPATIASFFEGQITSCALKPGVALLTAGRYSCNAETATTRVVCQSQKHQLLLTRK